MGYDSDKKDPKLPKRIEPWDAGTKLKWRMKRRQQLLKMDGMSVNERLVELERYLVKLQRIEKIMAIEEMFAKGAKP
jgi:hypothetical protein